MSDASLNAFGCLASFLVLAGVYVYVRACFVGKTPRQEAQPCEQPHTPVILRRIA